MDVPMPSFAYQAGHHWVSPHNYDPAVQETYEFPTPLRIVDSTLRKIMYTGGLRPSVDDLLRIAEALEEIGVREIILNVDWWGDAQPERLEYEVCRAVLARDFAFRTTVYSDSLIPYAVFNPAEFPVTYRQVVDVLREIGMTTLQIPLTDPRDPDARARQGEQIAAVVAYARSLGVEWTLGPIDVGRMDLDYLTERANAAIELGAIRLDLVDSYSSMGPEAMKLFLKRLRSRLTRPVPLTMHVHNDFGLGSATAVAAATAGAHPDVSVNGLSYRSGFAALEEVVVSLELLYGAQTGIRLERLKALSDLVADLSGMPKHPLKPLTGRQSFLQELPLWVVAYLEGGRDGFPPPASCIAPSIVGAEMGAIWGGHHSSFVIRTKLRQMGLDTSEATVNTVRERIEARVQALDDYPRWLEESEVEAICRAVAS